MASPMRHVAFSLPSRITVVTSRRWLLALWFCGMVSIMTLPWSDFQGHPHWARVSWVPFLGPVDNLRDVLLNVAVFVPFGFLLAQGRSLIGPLGLLGFLGAPVLVSAAGEFYQVFCHSRFPSATDVVSNTLGAYGGLLVHTVRDRTTPRCSR